MDDFAPFLRFLAWSSSCCWTLIVRWMDGWCVAVAPATPPALSPTRRPYRKCSVVAIYVVWYLVESPWPGTEGQIELMICGAKCETDSALPLKGNWNPSLHKIVDVFTHTPTHRQEAHSVRVPSWFPFFFFFFHRDSLHSLAKDMWTLAQGNCHLEFWGCAFRTTLTTTTVCYSVEKGNYLL